VFPLFREHIWCTWHLGAYIKSDPSISDPTLLGRLGDRELFVKFPSLDGAVGVGVFSKICK
jgi:hypothetical protein